MENTEKENKKRGNYIKGYKFAKKLQYKVDTSPLYVKMLIFLIPMSLLLITAVVSLYSAIYTDSKVNKKGLETIEEISILENSDFLNSDFTDTPDTYYYRSILDNMKIQKDIIDSLSLKKNLTQEDSLAIKVALEIFIDLKSLIPLENESEK